MYTTETLITINKALNYAFISFIMVLVFLEISEQTFYNFKEYVLGIPWLSLVLTIFLLVLIMSTVTESVLRIRGYLRRRGER